MSTKLAMRLAKPAAVVLIVLAVGVAGFALLRLEHLTQLPQSYQLDLDQQLRIAPDQIGYHQVAELPVQLESLHALAVGPRDRIHVAGDRVVHILSSDGALLQSIAVSAEPACLAVGDADHIEPGRIYVGAGHRIEVFSPQGESIAVWENPESPRSLTSLALGVEDVFVADATGRAVWRFNPEGQLLGRIGNSQEGQSGPGFIIPSPYFDVVCGPEGLLHAVNPGARRVETYTYAGELQSVWGQAGSTLDRFFGCCNPAHLTRLPDGSFVTSEKGIPRVKVYDASGTFVCAVAGPVELAVPKAAIGDPRVTDKKFVFDVAVDSQSRILVLDPIRTSVRIFVRNQSDTEDNHVAETPT